MALAMVIVLWAEVVSVWIISLGIAVVYKCTRLGSCDRPAPNLPLRPDTSHYRQLLYHALTPKTMGPRTYFLTSSVAPYDPFRQHVLPSIIWSHYIV